MATTSERLKCRYCNWSCLKWRTNKSGKRISGWRKLQYHLLDAHDIEADLIGDNEDAL
jgi:hypothetical protein